MVLPNKRIFRYFFALAEAGAETIRIGTKELAFFPQRFDPTFFNALDYFHSVHPNVRVCFMVHFTHPDECRDPETKQWYPETANPVKELLSRSYVSLYNQTPIIRDVNDNSEALCELQQQMSSKGINNYYFFQCRDIVGHKHFSLPLEETYEMIRRSKEPLSGQQATAKMCMSTEIGKMEVVGMNDSHIFFKLARSPDTSLREMMFVAQRNPKAMWVSDYPDIQEQFQQVLATKHNNACHQRSAA